VAAALAPVARERQRYFILGTPSGTPLRVAAEQRFSQPTRRFAARSRR
jgi:hypothetical protein